MRRASCCVLFLIGCGAAPSNQASIGQELYNSRCAACHDYEGAIGVRIDVPIIQSYRTAQALYNYTKFAMPYDAPRSLADSEYWALTAHLLRSRGLLDEETELGPDNAPAIEWPAPGEP